MDELQSRHSFFQAGAHRQKVAMTGIPDRVPVIAQMPEFARKELGVGPMEFYSRPDLIVDGTLAAMDRYGIDGPYLDFDVYNIEPEGMGMELIWSEHSLPDLNYAHPLITQAADLSRIKTPDFDVVGRFAHILEMYHQYEKKSGGVLPPFRCSAPFTLAANIRGISSLLVDIFMKPDFVRELLTRITEKVLAPWLLRIKEEFPHLTEIGADDALGSLPIVSPQIMQEWVLPAALDLKERVGPEVSVPNWVGEHCLEDPGILLDMKKQVCHNFIRVQDPDVEKFGPAVFKEYARAHDIHLCLGVGAAFLDSATPAQVAERVKHYLQAGAPGGRMTLYLCALSSATPRENVHAAIRAVREYGTY